MIDKADLRRGEPTINAAFDNQKAIVSGTYLYSVAIRLLSQIQHDFLLPQICSTVQALCEGELSQQYHLASSLLMITMLQFIKKQPLFLKQLRQVPSYLIRTRLFH